MKPGPALSDHNSPLKVTTMTVKMQPRKINNTVSDLQDAKQQRFCKQVPIGAGYDEMCKDFR